jgi:hypothetical protein
MLGHAVTIPTALALSELATNKRVEGGGEYFIISRSFGLNIGATIGIALFLSQAISVAFLHHRIHRGIRIYLQLCSTETLLVLPRQVISLPVTIFLGL